MSVKVPSDETQGPPRLFALAALSVAVGIFSGIVAASFRLLLHAADDWRTHFIVRAHFWGVPD
jgi:hypothetical protein